MHTSFILPEKREYDARPNSSRALWCNSNGEQFEDIEIEFAHALSAEECRAILQFVVYHTMHVIRQREVDLLYFNFFNPKMLGLTFHILSIGRDRTVFALLVALRQHYPVIRIGNSTYIPGQF